MSNCYNDYMVNNRVDFMERSPVITVLFHLRVSHQYRDIYYAKYYGKGGGTAGEKIKLGVGEKKDKKERKKEKNYIKKGERP